MSIDGLKLEVFASDKTVVTKRFHTYKIKMKKYDANLIKVIRGACRKLTNMNYGTGIFENGKSIFSTKIIANIPDDDEFELEYIGEQELDVLSNRRVYEGYIEFLLRDNLSQVMILNKYRKYSCKSGITSTWFHAIDGKYGTYSTEDKAIRLERLFSIKLEIRDDCKAYLWLKSKTLFVSKNNIMDMLKEGKNVIGIEVKNDWSDGKQTGTIQEVSSLTVSDEQEFGCSLKDYYINTIHRPELVENLPDDSPVIRVDNGKGVVLSYYPQALKPIVTREYMSKEYSFFSNQIDKEVKRDMVVRLGSDLEFIGDIGSIEQLDNLSFEKHCCNPEEMGFDTTNISLPLLVAGDGKMITCGSEYQIFNHGFYQKPVTKLKMGYLFPRGCHDLCQQLVFDIFYFATKGLYHGEKDQYTKAGLLDIQTKPIIQYEYDLNSITDYKRAALQLKTEEKVDMVIALIPDGVDEDNPYNPFKKTWAEMNIPSQMISIKTAKKFVADARNNSNGSKYYLHNIVLGILGKTGGIPWIVKEMPGNVDCFVGLDVSTIKKGLHVPACSVVFDKRGRMLGFYKPKTPQSGEIIGREILQDIFDNVIISYENAYGEKPRNIVIHRDGFSHEDAEWYRYYFGAQGIKYSIIEVRKNNGAKMIYEGSENKNPFAGQCIFDENKAYLVTTVMKNKKGSPNPLLIEKNCGDISLLDAVTQVLYLTQLHVGSTNKMRLPVTTGYADKICKNLEHVPAGELENKLFFL